MMRSRLATVPPATDRWLVALLTVLVALGEAVFPAQPTEVQFIFTSDAHYGLTRTAFRGASNVDAHVVNATMVGRINALSGVSFSDDGGLKAGRKVGPVDFVVEGGM